jgi:hypothetical protein
MAEYSDWEIHTADAATMQSAVNFLGFTQGEGFTMVSGTPVRYSIYIYGDKYTASTTQFITDRFGTRPVMVPLPGKYAILRWASPTPFPLQV